jgi:hypothetical protein
MKTFEYSDQNNNPTFVNMDWKNTPSIISKSGERVAGPYSIRIGALLSLTTWVLVFFAINKLLNHFKS